MKRVVVDYQLHYKQLQTITFYFISTHAVEDNSSFQQNVVGQDVRLRLAVEFLFMWYPVKEVLEKGFSVYSYADAYVRFWTRSFWA